MRRPQSITSAAPTSTFFGSHPRSAQVPPNGLESTIATCHPAALHLDVTADAADPVPIAIRSKFLVKYSTQSLSQTPMKPHSRWRELLRFLVFIEGHLHI